MLRVVGNFTVDRITASGRSWVAAGGSALYAAAAAGLVAKHLGMTPPYVAAPVGGDMANYDGLAEIADLSGVDVLDGYTFRWAAAYADDGSRTDTTDYGVSSGWEPRVEGWDGCTLLLATADPEMLLPVIKRANAGCVVFDTIEHWVDAKPGVVRSILEDVDVACVSHAEATLVTGCESTQDAATKLLEMGPDVVVVKAGGRGCLLDDGRRQTWLPSFPATRVLDVTGAGDSFVGAMAAMLDGGFTVREAAMAGCVLGSFAVQGRGVSGLLGLGDDAVSGRFAQYGVFGPTRAGSA